MNTTGSNPSKFQWLNRFFQWVKWKHFSRWGWIIIFIIVPLASLWPIIIAKNKINVLSHYFFYYVLLAIIYIISYIRGNYLFSKIYEFFQLDLKSSKLYEANQNNNPGINKLIPSGRIRHLFTQTNSKSFENFKNGAQERFTIKYMTILIGFFTLGVIIVVFYSTTLIADHYGLFMPKTEEITNKGLFIWLCIVPLSVLWFWVIFSEFRALWLAAVVIWYIKNLSRNPNLLINQTMDEICALNKNPKSIIPNYLETLEKAEFSLKQFQRRGRELSNFIFAITVSIAVGFIFLTLFIVYFFSNWDLTNLIDILNTTVSWVTLETALISFGLLFIGSITIIFFSLINFSTFYFPGKSLRQPFTYVKSCMLDSLDSIFQIKWKAYNDAKNQPDKRGFLNETQRIRSLATSIDGISIWPSNTAKMVGASSSTALIILVIDFLTDILGVANFILDLFGLG